MVRHRLLSLSLTALALLGARPAVAGPITFTGTWPTTSPDRPERPGHQRSEQLPPGRPAGLDDESGPGLGLGDQGRAHELRRADRYAVRGRQHVHERQGTACDRRRLRRQREPGRGLGADGRGGRREVPQPGRPRVGGGRIRTRQQDQPERSGSLVLVAGVPAIKTQASTGAPQFEVATPTAGALGYNFGQTIANAGSLAFNPSQAHPGFEFTIKNFSKISGLDPYNGFWISLYAGSPDDVVVR